MRHAARLTVRVPPDIEAGLHAAVEQMQRVGVPTSQSELLELFVAEGVAMPTGEMALRLRRRRGEPIDVEGAS